MVAGSNLGNMAATSTLFVATVSIIACGKTIYVDADANGLNDGSSWADAYYYLQEALADANSSPKPIEIRVAQGVYRPDQGAGITPGDRHATFQLINGVPLKGGYAGLSEPDPNARDIESYEAILSGDLDSNDVDVNDPAGPLIYVITRRENSFTVVTGSGTNGSAVLDGFAITAGNGMYNSTQPDGTGAGMYNDEGNPTISNCTFNENWAVAGGGVYNNQSSPILTNCNRSQ